MHQSNKNFCFKDNQLKDKVFKINSGCELKFISISYTYTYTCVHWEEYIISVLNMIRKTNQNTEMYMEPTCVGHA